MKKQFDASKTDLYLIDLHNLEAGVLVKYNMPTVTSDEGEQVILDDDFHNWAIDNSLWFNSRYALVEKINKLNLDNCIVIKKEKQSMNVFDGGQIYLIEKVNLPMYDGFTEFNRLTVAEMQEVYTIAQNLNRYIEVFYFEGLHSQKQIIVNHATFIEMSNNTNLFIYDVSVLSRHESNNVMLHV